MRNFLTFVMVITCGLGVGFPYALSAADTTPPVPPISAALLEDDTPFIVSPDGPAVVRLPSDAASVVVGNPIHATAVIENPRLIMLIPGQPGGTSLTVLDTNGQVILNRKIQVSGGNSKSGTLRINNVCAGPNKPNECKPAKIYRCQGRCFETNLPPVSVDGTAIIPTPPAPAPRPAPAAPETNDPAGLITPEAPLTQPTESSDGT